MVGQSVNELVAIHAAEFVVGAQFFRGEPCGTINHRDRKEEAGILGFLADVHGADVTGPVEEVWKRCRWIARNSVRSLVGLGGWSRSCTARAKTRAPSAATRVGLSRAPTRLRRSPVSGSR